VLFLDLDRFKVVNDSLGHSAGDELLRVLSGRLLGVCRDVDLVARLGGDEFVVVAAGLDEEAALLLTQRVQHVLAMPVEVAGHELVASASIGVVVAAADSACGAEQLLRDADVSMYRAKSRGRARAVVWTEEIGREAVSLLSVEHDLRLALEQGQLLVHYQPQVDLVTGTIEGVEALVRWEHPERGLLLPRAFLEVAEQTGLVGRLGLAVLIEASAQVARWRLLPGHEDLGLSVNVSGQELTDPALAERVLKVLAEQGLDRRALTVEVLESVLLDPEGSTLESLAHFVDLGIALVLDDFGTGSSSLLHLRDVPVDGVKVDRSFVSGLPASPVDEAIVRAVALLSADLGLTCTAEGVETAGQRAWLVEQGFTRAQGFLLHRPVCAEEMTASLVSSLDP
jgi:Amt family ammonium transporter